MQPTVPRSNSKSIQFHLKRERIFSISVKYSFQWLSKNCSEHSKLNMYSLPLLFIAWNGAALNTQCNWKVTSHLFFWKIVAKFWGKSFYNFYKKCSFVQWRYRHCQYDALHAENQHNVWEYHSCLAYVLLLGHQWELITARNLGTSNKLAKIHYRYRILAKNSEKKIFWNRACNTFS